MPIATGTRLGPYEIVAPVGAGGMGEVYRGTDTRLDRVVALKILPSHLSSNAELRERFDREARAISSLSHPHICTLYDVGHHAGTDYLVMEFVEGESLAERLAKGPLPIEQVFRYGIEIAEALDKAHRSGIVHRDLKPSNIMITKSGVKLLDFGLAKMAVGPPPSAALTGAGAGPTLQKPVTQEGTILGTFQYMAPEQLEGLEADARTDIFAFGTVLYEMATGRRAFEAKTKTSLIAAIVDRDPPPISSIQPLTPPAFERVVKTCLAKDPDDRWQSARDVANELRWIQQGAAVAAPIVRRRKSSEWIAWAVALAALIATGALAVLYHRATAEPPQSVQSAILPPEKTAFAFRGPTGGFALSPDGRRIALIVSAEGKTMLWLRPLNALSAQPLLGTEGAAFPFWSPDGRFIAFFANSKLKKIDVSGGPPQVLCDVGSQPRGGTWSKDGIILFAANTRDPISKVAASGGTPSPVTQLAKSDFSHRFPSFLPDGRHFLYVAQTFGGNASSGSPSSRNIVCVGSLERSERRSLFPSNGAAVYSPPGYVVFPRERTLYAQRFDAGKLRPEGEAFSIADSVQTFPGTLTAMFSLSNTGVLAYERSENITGLQLVWMDRNGKEIEALTPPGDYNHPSLSHDGKRIAYEQQDPGAGADIWVLDLARRVPTRLTFEPEDETNPIWSPDDSKIAYGALQTSGSVTFAVLEKASTGTAAAEVLWSTNGIVFPSQWPFEGTILHWSIEPKSQNSFDIGQLSLQNRTSIPLIASRFDDVAPKLSADGRWLAYAANVSGAMEIYIEPYPPSGAKWQVSNGGGSMPRWRRDGKELFFRANDDRLMSVTINATAHGLEISTPSPLFQTHMRQALGFQYDVSADGKKFLMNVAKGGDDRTTVTLVTNWAAELKR